MVPNGEDASFAKPLELTLLVGMPLTAPSLGFANPSGVLAYASIFRDFRFKRPHWAAAAVGPLDCRWDWIGSCHLANGSEVRDPNDVSADPGLLPCPPVLRGGIVIGRPVGPALAPPRRELQFVVLPLK